MSKTLFDSVHLPNSPFDELMRLIAGTLRAHDFVRQEFTGGVILNTLPTTPGDEDFDFAGNQIVLSPVLFQQAGEQTRSTYAACQIMFSFRWQGFDAMPATEEGKTAASLVSWLASICGSKEVRQKTGNYQAQVVSMAARSNGGRVIIDIAVQLGLNIFYYKTTPGA